MNLSKIILTYCQCCCCLNSNTHMLHNLILYACDGNIEPTQYYIETIMDAHIYLSYVWMIRFKHNLGEKQNKGSINTTIASQYYHTLHSYRRIKYLIRIFGTIYMYIFPIILYLILDLTNFSNF